MASARTATWLDRLSWTLLYAGLLAGSLGLATRPQDAVAGGILLVAGGCLVAAGMLLLWLRSRISLP